MSRLSFLVSSNKLYHITLTQDELKCRHLTFDDIVLYLLQFKLYFLFNRFHIHSYVVSGRLKGQIFFLSALIYPIDSFSEIALYFQLLVKIQINFPNLQLFE